MIAPSVREVIYLILVDRLLSYNYTKHINCLSFGNVQVVTNAAAIHAYILEYSRRKDANVQTNIKEHFVNNVSNVINIWNVT